jgi:hypothetical protein
VDTLGLLPTVVVTAARVQDRDDAMPLLTRLAAPVRALPWCGPIALIPGG